MYELTFGLLAISLLLNIYQVAVCAPGRRTP